MNKDINKRKAGLLFTWESDELHWMIVTPEFYQRVKEIIEVTPSNEWTHQTEGQVIDILLGIMYLPEEKQTRHNIYVSDILEDGFTQTFCREEAHFLNKYEFVGMTTYPSY